MVKTICKVNSHLSIPGDILKSIDNLVDHRKRSKFITEITRKELKRIQMKKALESAAGAWKDKNHPEIQEKGTYNWVRDLREEEEKRLILHICRN